jgi:hypothetical protein
MIVLEGAEPFMTTVVGWGDDNSYAYVGGIGAEVINPTPRG